MPRIVIGNQSSFAAPRPLFPFEYALAAGFGAFEFFPDRQADGRGWEISELDAATRADLRNAADGHDLRLSVHAPWWLDPRQPDALPELLEVQRFAFEIGARLLNIHFYLDQGPELLLRAIEPLIERLARAGQRLALENTVETSPEAINEVFALLRARRPDLAAHVGLCLDIGHANLCAATRNDYLAFVDRLAADLPIIHGHLHENWGDADTHLTLFTGPAAHDSAGIEGLIDRLLARGFAGAWILEQWPEPHELLDDARDRLLVLLQARGVRTRTRPLAAAP